MVSKVTGGEGSADHCKGFLRSSERVIRLGCREEREWRNHSNIRAHAATTSGMTTVQMLFRLKNGSGATATVGEDDGALDS